MIKTPKGHRYVNCCNQCEHSRYGPIGHGDKSGIYCSKYKTYTGRDMICDAWKEIE